ncbi:hypothetical protein [Cupriavidus campinensis]|uniref:DUF1328 domain-containing protein n=1 Tax=Cupriavidus campinensis TaxID=151783 RepID=A0ABY3ESR8_9BURK|nr:hypothetical protein [Cupriavidus campinensis]TSP14020.1 hypothetical protein FGG12_05995 [Cupriavidus campinensis]
MNFLITLLIFAVIFACLGGIVYLARNDKKGWGWLVLVLILFLLSAKVGNGTGCNPKQDATWRQS